MALSVRAGSGGCIVEVRATPKASADAIRGETGDRLKVAVTAAPEKGKANVAVTKLLAGALGVAKGDITLATGQTSRDKAFLVRGLSPEVAAAKLERFI